MRINYLLPALLVLSSSLIACGDDGGPVDAGRIDALPASGTFSLAWTVSDGSAALSCDDVGAVSVSITLIQQGSAGGTVDAFSCEGGMATSRNFAPGLYDLTIDLRASGSRSLIGTPVRLTGIEITANADTPLPAQEFVVSPTGGFTFTVNGGATGGNCAPDSNNGGDGAGIIGLEFSLKDSSDTCVPTTFSIAAGAGGVAGTYTTDCITPPAPHACIDADQVVTVDPTRSGAKTLTINGQKDDPNDDPDLGPIDCYDRVSMFVIPGAMLVRDLGSLLLSLEYSLACDPDFIEIDAGM
jgi:hypothetical protein